MTRTTTRQPDTMSGGRDDRRKRFERLAGTLAALDLGRLAVPASLASGVVFVVASVTGGHFIYAASLLIFALGLAGFLARPLPAGVRWAGLARFGLVLALAAALADGFLDLADAIGTATNITTIGIIVGLALFVVGRGRVLTRPRAKRSTQDPTQCSDP